MLSMIRYILVVAVLGAGIGLLSPEKTQAFPDQGRYWNNYWQWYDGTYRPYWQRRHNSYRDYGYRYNPYYGNNSYYYNPYYRSYSPYGYNYYYRDRHSLRGPHNSLELGPLHIDWR